MPIKSQPDDNMVYQQIINNRSVKKRPHYQVAKQVAPTNAEQPVKIRKLTGHTFKILFKVEKIDRDNI